MLWPTLAGMLAYGFMEAAPLCGPQPEQGGEPALKLSRRVVALGPRPMTSRVTGESATGASN